MSAELFEVRFFSNEQDFIHNFGVNRGYTMSYSKVDRCYFLSSGAKTLYHNICGYAWGNKRECTPSQTTLKTELGWGRHAFEKYLNELRAVGLVTTEQPGKMKPLTYRLNELSSCQIIIHSEVVHQVRKQLELDADQFAVSLELYKKSDLCASIIDPVGEYAEIFSWFEGTPTVAEVTGGEAQQFFELTPQRKNPLPKVIDHDPDAERVSSLDVKKSKSKPVDSDPNSPERWNAVGFAHYFQRQFQGTYGAPYEVTKKDGAQIVRLLRDHLDKTKVKANMDLYLKLDFFSPKTLAIFCSGYTQSALAHYNRTGKLPSSKPSKEKESSLAIEMDLSDYDFTFKNERENT